MARPELHGPVPARAVWAYVVPAALVAALSVVLIAVRSPDGSFSYDAVSVVALVAILTCVTLSWIGLRTTRRLAESELTMRAQDELLAIAGEVGRIGGWRVDVHTNEGYWAPEVGEILGFDRDRSHEVGLQMDMYVGEDRTRIEQAFLACVVDGTPFDLESQLDRPDGRRIWVQTFGRAVHGPDGTVKEIHGAIQDVTVRRTAELEAEEQQKMFTSFADSMPLMVFVSDAEGRPTFASRKMLDYAGAQSLEELDGQLWKGVMHPEEYARAAALWSHSMATGRPYDIDLRIRVADGDYHWHRISAAAQLDDDGAILRWWGTAVDVQEQRGLEETSALLAERLSDTLESIGDAVLGLDRDWCITLMNQHAEFLLQSPRDELLGRNVWEAFPEAAGSVFQTSYETAVREQRVIRFEAPYEPLGLYVEISAYPHPEGLTIYFRDVTGQRALAEQLAHSQRLDALGKLTGGVAHDFNNLLTVILGSAEVLSAELADSPRMQSLADTIASVSRRGADLTHDLLAFARRQPLEPTDVDVEELVRSVHELLSRTLGEGVTLGGVTAPGLPPVRADRTQLQNALLNLCINARDAMPRGGRVTVTATLSELGAEHPDLPADLVPGPYVTLTVDDDGIGIAAADLDRVFEPFFTTKDIGQGTGLGLAMVYGFARQSGGHVTVRSEVGVGSTFTLYLPVATDRTGHTVADTAQDLDAARHERGTVLLVEDDDQVRAVAREHLLALGYEVVDAPDGRTAMAFLDDGREVDVLLTDVVMRGGLSGPELAERAAALHPALRVLFTSGFTGEAVLPDDLTASGAKLLRKPYGRAELARHLGSFPRRREGASR